MTLKISLLDDDMTSRFLQHPDSDRAQKQKTKTYETFDFYSFSKNVKFTNFV